ncbi:hypothetical protein CDIK_2988 [Cucumispora dikerogammari]|nr:hypothetical protein CDIK_2988 [Cucumispora dikerogammari]
MAIIGQYIFETNKGFFFYKRDLNNEKNSLKRFNFNETFLQTLLMYDEKTEAAFYIELCKMNCKCKKHTPFLIKTVTKSPSLNIMNHLELYSCHDNEFEPLFQKHLLPRKNGIVWKNFYFLIDGANVPGCCNNKFIKYETENIRKIFIDEIDFDCMCLNMKNNEEVIETIFYYFFKDIFKSYKVINLGHLMLKKLNECFVLVETLEKNTNNNNSSSDGRRPGVDKSLFMYPAIQIQFKIEEELYEIDKIDLNSNLLDILLALLKKNSVCHQFAFLRNFDSSSKIPISIN